MTPKIYAKPPKALFVAQTILLPLFMIFGLGFLIIAQGEARIFVALFVLIWEAACIAIFINAIKALRMIKNGKIEVAEISGLTEDKNSFASKLRELDDLKKDGLVTEEEYQRKRSEIMNEKW